MKARRKRDAILDALEALAEATELLRLQLGQHQALEREMMRVLATADRAPLASLAKAVAGCVAQGREAGLELDEAALVFAATIGATNGTRRTLN